MSTVQHMGVCLFTLLCYFCHFSVFTFFCDWYQCHFRVWKWQAIWCHFTILVCCWSSSPICCLNLSCCMARKKEEAFARLQKKRRQQKSFELVMGIFRSIQTFQMVWKKKHCTNCAFSWENWKMFFYKLSFSSRTNTQNNPTFFKSKGRAKPARKKSELDVQHKTIRRSRS